MKRVQTLSISHGLLLLCWVPIASFSIRRFVPLSVRGTENALFHYVMLGLIMHKKAELTI